MNVTENEIQEFSEVCIYELGDIFWDRDSYDTERLEYADPYEVAADAISKCLSEFLRNRGVHLTTS